MWDSVKLEDLFKIGSSKRVLKAEWKDSGVPFYRGREITTLSKSGAVDNDLFISEEHFSKLKANHGVPQSGDLLVTAIGTIGNTYIVREQDRFYFKDASVLWLQKISDVDIRFVNYWFKSSLFYSQLEVGNGATVDTLSISKLKAMNFLLPPLAEQQRTVAKLDAVFAEIDEAIEQVEAKQAEAERLKASLLGISIRGDAVMWETVKLGDVCELIGGGTPSKKNAAYYGGEIPWATVRDMHSDELSKTELKITQLGLENSSSKVIPANNIVIASRVGLGKVCLLNQSTAINQDLRGVIPKKSDTIDVRFLFYWFKSIEQTIISAGRGATVHGVTLPFLKALELSLPPLAEQQHIVAKLDAAFAEIENISATTSKSKENYSFLKSAILAQELQPLQGKAA
tara:strand:- start:1137 stop:2333 length:1197 start_codon:yes stop_codon:yes gene_type:complete